ncbi:hypothetical protein NIES4072_64470 [Nostoc commune NIES-4072]|uniref:Uncharacterized protein n=1 Tax=Nostoc commune NIES-4072 TaxID=2005467 RepID=A0A2R5FWS3_NOSCO|nr:hypothetical protein [Nostoc commune]BBD70067.1 hypothetical protein NIES4070_64780 [Nostoc commune HK-02]GBG22735.1 hypothetical protein NIES4072_64470 [Nostoc commune NIES-4072]
MKTQKAAYQSSLPSNTRNKLVLRRTRKRFKPKVFIDHTIETTAIVSLLITGFSGVGAMGCWGMEIATSSQHWQQQKNICLGGMLVSFSAFLSSALIGASFSIQRDKF